MFTVREYQSKSMFLQAPIMQVFTVNNLRTYDTFNEHIFAGKSIKHKSTFLMKNTNLWYFAKGTQIYSTVLGSRHHWFLNKFVSKHNYRCIDKHI